jgi:uncharacterized membrane protein HdeD (DUF308 family)
MVQPAGGTDDRVSIVVFDMEPVRRNRGWFFGLGIAFLALGILLILMPMIASLVSAMVLGWMMVIGGLFQGYHAIRARGWKGAAWSLVSAALLAGAGLLVVLFPITGTLTLTLILSAFFIANGVAKIVRALQHRGMPSWGWLLGDGILSLALGFLIFAGWPSTAAWAIGLLVGIDFLLGGSSMILIGLAAGPLGARPGASLRL